MIRWIVRSSRLALLAAAPLALLSAAPAAARDDAAADADIRNFARELQDPARGGQIADVVGAMMRAVMAMPVGGIANAVGRADPNSPMADIPADATVADLAGLDSERLPARVAGQTRAATAMMGQMAGAMAEMMPTFRAMARDMGAQMERQMAEAERQTED